MRLIFAGTPAAAVPSLFALLESGHKIVAVISRPDAPIGRGRKVAPSAVAAVAREQGLELLTPVSARDPEFVARLRELAPDAAAVVAYGQLLRQDVLEVPTHGWVNLHFSLLPAWRGAAPVQAAIRAGDDITGATTFRLEVGMDTGPVYGVVTEPIGATDTAGVLLERLSVSGAKLLVATIDAIAGGTVVAVPQPVEGVSSAPKTTAAQARIDWSLPAAAIDRRVRSVTPAPGAWTDSPWGRLQLGPVLPTKVADQPTKVADQQTKVAGQPTEVAGQPTEVVDLAPGELLVDKKQVLVGTGTVAVRLGQVQPPGRRPMAAADWARGMRPAAGTVLGGPPMTENILHKGEGPSE